jgi:hypothetical protein
MLVISHLKDLLSKILIDAGFNLGGTKSRGSTTAATTTARPSLDLDKEGIPCET